MANQVSLQSPDRLSLMGELNMQSVPEVLGQVQQAIAGSTGKLVVDLAGVTRSDSAGVALLIEILREYQSTNLQISFANLPVQMLDIARASDLDSVLPLSEH